MKNASNPKSETRLSADYARLASPRGPWAILVSLACLAVGISRLPAEDSVPAAINYQGKLTDSEGHPLPAGYYDVEFRIWDHATLDGESDYIWGRVFSLNVASNGMFNVLLSNAGGELTKPNATGKVSSLLDAFESDKRYLGLSISRTPEGAVSSPVEISPRQQLVTAPYAIHAHQASLATIATYSANAGSATNASLAYNTTRFGNFNTNDFLMSNKPSQTLTGNLTVNGKVGVGISSPAFPLTFASTLGDKISLYGNSGAHYGFGIGNYLLQIHSSQANTDIGFGYGDSASFTERMRIKGDGKVGIGTSAPERTLHVRGGTMLDLGGNGGGALVLANNPGDNAIYLEGFNSTHNGNAAAVHITGAGDQTLPVFNIKAAAVQVQRVAPIVIKSFYPPDLGKDDRTAHNYDTYMSTNDYSAVVAGFRFDGDIYESNFTSPLIMVRMQRVSGKSTWQIVYGMSHQSDPLTGIVVDGMFIRRELTEDKR
jgi:hypothetical protein